jgi:hypothetical protein
VLTCSGLVLLVQSPATGFLVAVCGAGLVAVFLPLSIRLSGVRGAILTADVLLDWGLLRICLLAGVIPGVWMALTLSVPTDLLKIGWSRFDVGMGMVPAAGLALMSQRKVPSAMARWGERNCLVVAMSGTCSSLVLAVVGFAADRPVLLIASLVIATSAFSVGQPSLFSAVAKTNRPTSAPATRSGYAQFLFLYCSSIGAAVMGGIRPVAGPAAAVGMLLVIGIGATVVARRVIPNGGRRGPRSHQPRQRSDHPVPRCGLLPIRDQHQQDP